jgi:cytochrome c oxidase subunit 3
VSAKDDHSLRIAVWILIASEALLFAVMFALYVGYRAEYPAVFAAGVEHNVQWIGGVNTLILIASSFALAWVVHLARLGGRDHRASWWMVLALLLGTAFIILKLVEWFRHIDEGIVLGTSYAGPNPGHGIQMFFTLYFLMTGIHMFHLAFGMALVAWMLVLARRAALSSHLVALELVAAYWNFVDLVWIFLWPLFYLMRTTS